MNAGLLKRALTVVLLVVFASSLLATTYVALDPPQSTDAYSEFYLLGSGKQAADYPTKLAPGESGSVIIGVTNHEGESTDYVVRVVNLNATNDSHLATASRTVGDDETWEKNVTVAIDEPGRHPIQFQLYKGDASGTPYLTTRLWITLTSTNSTVADGSGTANGSPTVNKSPTGNHSTAASDRGVSRSLAASGVEA